MKLLIVRLIVYFLLFSQSALLIFLLHFSTEHIYSSKNMYSSYRAGCLIASTKMPLDQAVERCELLAETFKSILDMYQNEVSE